MSRCLIPDLFSYIFKVPWRLEGCWVGLNIWQTIKKKMLKLYHKQPVVSKFSINLTKQRKLFMAISKTKSFSGCISKEYTFLPKITNLFRFYFISQSSDNCLFDDRNKMVCKIAPMMSSTADKFRLLRHNHVVTA